MRVFKVVTRTLDGKLRSIVIYPEDPNCRIYTPGLKTRPRAGKLFVFKSAARAMRFAHSDSRTTFCLLEGEATDVEPATKMLYYGKLDTPKAIEQFWAGQSPATWAWTPPPSKYYICSSFLPLKNHGRI